jgi:methyl-accepting chemotaxis protein
MSLVPNTPSRAPYQNGHDPARAGLAKVAKAGNKRVDDRRSQARTLARQQQAAERISEAATQLANGVTEATAASEQLGQSME